MISLKDWIYRLRGDSQWQCLIHIGFVPPGTFGMFDRRIIQPSKQANNTLGMNSIYLSRLSRKYISFAVTMTFWWWPLMPSDVQSRAHTLWTNWGLRVDGWNSLNGTESESKRVIKISSRNVGYWLFGRPNRPYKACYAVRLWIPRLLQFQYIDEIRTTVIDCSTFWFTSHTCIFIISKYVSWTVICTWIEYRE